MVLSLGERERVEAGQLKAFRNCVGRDAAQLVLGGWSKRERHGGEVREVGGGPEGPVVNVLEGTGASERKPRERVSPELEVARRATGEVSAQGAVDAAGAGAVDLP